MPPAKLRLLAISLLTLFLAWSWLAPAGSQDPSSAPPRNRNEVIIPPEPLTTLDSVRLTGGDAYHAAPAMAVAPDGKAWLAWIRYAEGKGDEIVAAHEEASGRGPQWTAPQTLSPGFGQYVRPVIAATKKDAWCFWTATNENARAAVWFSRWAKDGWSPAARLLPDEKLPHQNPEATTGPDGRLAVVYQIHTGKNYDIHLRLWNGDKWEGPFPVSTPATDDWDPAAAFDAKGNLHVAWSGFLDGDYDVYVSLASLPSFTSSNPRRISARGDYDLHPWLAPAPDGSMWISWDRVKLPGHNLSGETTITGANLKKMEGVEGTLHAGGGKGWIEVRVLDGDSVRVPGNPKEEIVAPKGYLLANRGMGKIAVGADGVPWIVFRTLLRRHAPWSASVRDGYLWDLMARPYRDGRWGGPVLFAESDGYLEEPAVAASKDGVRVAWSADHRRTTSRKVSHHVPAGEATGSGAPARPSDVKGYDHHQDFDGLLGWKGDIYQATLDPTDKDEKSKNDEMTKYRTEDAPPDRTTDNLLPREAGRHDVKAGNGTFRLLWGDTHRHSNVSRCSVGAEPNPNDLYRYGADVHRYDFFALSDHSEYTTDWFWWVQQKLVDLYHIPGAYSVLYNSEWSMSWPNGHHNTVFPSRPAVKINGFRGAGKDLTGGWKILEAAGVKAITIPHTTATGAGTDWSVQDDRYRRLCEIFQAARGSFEHKGCPREYTRETGNPKHQTGYYMNALEKGHHIGVICSSDHGYGCAYACVYASENTREAVWQAMYDRRTYGSTTYGLVLEVRSGDHWMGEEWSAKEPPKLDIYVRGAAPIRSVEILGRSKVLFADGSPDQPLNAAEYRKTWTDPDWVEQTKEQWYYVRVIQTDDEMAWSSPVWVIPLK